MVSGEARERNRWVRPMHARSVDAEHRAATPLELFFDLCFVVAVAQAATSLEHAVAHEEWGHVVVSYSASFFAIWWAWMNFTWFSSAYDNDDVPYRLGVLVQIAGVLILAAGIPRAFDDGDFGIVTLGYAVMRVALVAQWLRAARDDPERRSTDRRYALGVGLCMVGWGTLLLLPSGAQGPGFAVMVLLELLVPPWAESAGTTTWHPRHIAERYSLFTLIVLGEAVLAATTSVQAGFDSDVESGNLVTIAAGGLLVVFSMWWLYFGLPTDEVVERARFRFTTLSAAPFVWGYGHFFVFASAAAVGAGIAVAAEQTIGEAHLSTRTAVAAVSIPVAVFLLGVWGLHVPDDAAARRRSVAIPVVALLIPLAAFLWPSVLVPGLILAALVVYKELSLAHPTRE